MYGYVRPERGELKVREYELFRGAYCGLCHTLKKRYGPLLRFAVNYDFTFLAMLLAGPEKRGTCKKRCPYHPVRVTACPEPDEAMDAAADCTVILAYWKLRDGVADKGFFGSLGCRLLSLALRPAWRKASRLRPEFGKTAEEELRQLSALEREQSPSIDAPADRFARILRAVSGVERDPVRRRVLGELLYHLGRIVYLLDAADDLKEDTASGAYNPLRFRFVPVDGKLSPEDEKELRLSLQHSHNSISAAYSLLDKNPYEGILTNIIYIGLPAVTQAVFSGVWRASRRDKTERSRL